MQNTPRRFHHRDERAGLQVVRLCDCHPRVRTLRGGAAAALAEALVVLARSCAAQSEHAWRKRKAPMAVYHRSVAIGALRWARVMGVRRTTREAMEGANGSWGRRRSTAPGGARYCTVSGGSIRPNGQPGAVGNGDAAARNAHQAGRASGQRMGDGEDDDSGTSPHHFRVARTHGTSRGRSTAQKPEREGGTDGGVPPERCRRCTAMGTGGSGRGLQQRRCCQPHAERRRAPITTSVSRNALHWA